MHKKFTAMILAAAMTMAFSGSPMASSQIAGNEAESETEMSLTPVTEAETPAPATEAATSAPVTEAPTEAPAPATEATEAAGTEAQTTEASGTEAPATEAAATEAPATETSGTEASGTEAQETDATENPTDTEAPTESENGSETNTEQSEAASETVTETESNAQTESETASETVTESESASETETVSETETASETETESEAETETETETETEKKPEKPKPEKPKPQTPTQPQTAGQTQDAGLGELYLAVNGYPVASLTENEKEAYRYLRNELGLSKAGASGVLANIYCESNFSTVAIGDGGTSLGLCQWHAERCRSLIGWCQANEYDYRSAEGQLNYLGAELNGGYKGVYDYILNVPDTAEGAYQAAYYFCMYFESPDSVQTRSDARGKIAANTYFAADLDLMLVEEEEDDETPKTTSADVNANFEAYMEEKRKIEDPVERLSEINTDMMLIKTGFVL